MKLWKVIKQVGSGIIRNTVPGGGLLIDAVNAALPADKKLSTAATGDDLQEAINALPAGERAELLNREFDVEITQIKESHSTIRAMLEADSASKHTTRPYIAKGAFQVIAACSLAVVFMWSYGIISQDKDLVSSITDGWPFVLSVIGPFISLLWAYFGILKAEHKDKLRAANGFNSAPDGLLGILTNVINRK